MATTRDPYQVLGLSRTASVEDIKQAYRKLAKKYHPDLNPGRSDIEQRFKEVSAAYTLLSDADKRARFDRGEIDANGNERVSNPFRRSQGGTRRPGERANPFEGGFNPEDLFADLFGGRKAGAGKDGPGAGFGGAGAGVKARGSDITYTVTISFTEAAQGAKRRVSLSNGKSLDVSIPAGAEDQQKLRLKGQGMAGSGGAPAGDAIVEVNVEPHPYFTRSGADVHLEMPVTLGEAVLGATIKVPTISGKVALKIPPGSNTGSMLRVKGKGIVDANKHITGDQYVKLKVVLPDPPDAELVQFVERWAKERSYDVRAKAGME